MKKHISLIAMLLFTCVSIAFALSGNDEAYIKAQWEQIDHSLENIYQAKASWLAKSGELDLTEVGIEEELIQKVKELNVNEDVYGRILRIIKIRNDIKSIEEVGEAEREAIKEACNNMNNPLKECLGEHYKEVFTIDPISYWELKTDNSGYKNERYIDLQKYAVSRGIEEWKLLPYSVWYTQENGALSENQWARGGEKSFGLCMCNIPHRGCNAETNKSGKGYILGDYEAQRKVCTDWFIEYTKNSTPETIYQDIRVGHNGKHPTYQYEMKEKESLFVQK